MNSLANEFRENALEAQVMELETHDPFLRRAYAKVATHWLELATRTEHEELAAAVVNSADPAGTMVEDTDGLAVASFAAQEHGLGEMDELLSDATKLRLEPQFEALGMANEHRAHLETAST